MNVMSEILKRAGEIISIAVIVYLEIIVRKFVYVWWGSLYIAISLQRSFEGMLGCDQ